jgi:hypothetical protein
MPESEGKKQGSREGGKDRSVRGPEAHLPHPPLPPAPFPSLLPVLLLPLAVPAPTCYSC